MLERRSGILGQKRDSTTDITPDASRARHNYLSKLLRNNEAYNAT